MPLACFLLVATLHGHGWLGLRPLPHPWAVDPTLSLDLMGQNQKRAHSFHGNQQRLLANVQCSRSSPLSCCFHCPVAPSGPLRLHAHFSLSGAVVWCGCVFCFVIVILYQAYFSFSTSSAFSLLF